MKKKSAIVLVKAAQQNKKLVEHGRFHERVDGTMIFIRKINTNEINFKDNCVSFNTAIYDFKWWEKTNAIHVIIRGRLIGKRIYKISKQRFDLVKTEEFTPWGEINIRVPLDEFEEKQL